MPNYPVTKAGLGLAPQRLHEALKAANVPLLTVMGSGADQATVVSNASGLQGQIAAVVAALDLTIATAAEQQATTDMTSLSDLAAQAAATVTRMQQIEAAGSPTNAQVIQAVRDEAAAIRRIMQALSVMARRQVLP